MERIPQGTTRRQLLKAYLASDHLSAATGKTLAVTLSKNGGAFANPHAGATDATEVANGWYFVDLDVTDTATLGPLVIRATATGVDDVELLLTVVDPSVSLSASGCQQIARESHGCHRTVWHVAIDGNDTNDGLSWATAKASPKTVIEAASAGDLVLLSAGVFALGNAGISAPDDVSIRGAGAGRTILTSELVFAAVLIPIVRPGSRSRIERLTIRGLSDASNLQCAVGVAFTQSAFVDAVISDCELDGNDHAVGCQTPNTTLRVERCILRGQQDATVYSAATGVLIDVADSRLFTNSPLTNACRAGGVGATDGGHVIVRHCTIDAQSYGTYDMYGIWSQQGSEVLAYDCAIRVHAANGAAASLQQDDTARLIVCGCQYDKSTAHGTVLDIDRIVTNANGHAQAAVDANERQLLSDALLDRADGIETGVTLRHAMRIVAAVLAGKVTGAGSGIERFHGLDGVTPRVAVTADTLGNRSSVLYTVE